IEIGRLSGPLPCPPQESENPGLREFWRAADSAMQLVGLAQQAFGDPVEQLPADGAAPLRAPEPLQRLAQRADVLRNLVTVLRVSAAHRLQNLGETGPPPALLRREIGSSPERFAIG